MRRAGQAAGALLVALLASACAFSAPPSKNYDIATGPGDPILSISAFGGMPPPYPTPDEPELTLFGDGLVIVNCSRYADVTPVLACLQQARLRPSEVQRVLAAADRAGLLGPDASFEKEYVTDQQTTRFETTVAGRVHTVEVYALGEEAQEDAEADVLVAAARTRAFDFRNSVEDLSSFTGRAVEFVPYGGTALQVQAVRDLASSEAVPTQALDWPLGSDPSHANEYSFQVTLTGADMAAFLAVTRTATTATLWRLRGGYYHLVAGPLYPGETPAVASPLS